MATPCSSFIVEVARVLSAASVEDAPAATTVAHARWQDQHVVFPHVADSRGFVSVPFTDPKHRFGVRGMEENDAQ